MKTSYEITKSQTGCGYILTIHNADGTQDSYRFKFKREILFWLNTAGLK